MKKKKIDLKKPNEEDYNKLFSLMRNRKFRVKRRYVVQRRKGVAGPQRLRKMKKKMSTLAFNR